MFVKVAHPGVSKQSTVDLQKVKKKIGIFVALDDRKTSVRHRHVPTDILEKGGARCKQRLKARCTVSVMR